MPVHGAPHQHQWLADGQRLGLIDFDRFALGDPELDLAVTLAVNRVQPMSLLVGAGGRLAPAVINCTVTGRSAPGPSVAGNAGGPTI